MKQKKQRTRARFAAAVFVVWAVFAVAPPAHAGFWSEIKSLPDRFIEGVNIAGSEALPEFSGAAKNAAVSIGGGIVQGLKFPAVLGEKFSNGAVAGAGKVSELGNFAADNLATGLKTIGGAANAGAGRRGVQQKSEDSLLSEFKSGKVPETDDEMDRLALARMKARAGK